MILAAISSASSRPAFCERKRHLHSHSRWGRTRIGAQMCAFPTSSVSPHPEVSLLSSGSAKPSRSTPWWASKPSVNEASRRRGSSSAKSSVWPKKAWLPLPLKAPQNFPCLSCSRWNVTLAPGEFSAPPLPRGQRKLERNHCPTWKYLEQVEEKQHSHSRRGENFILANKAGCESNSRDGRTSHKANEAAKRGGDLGERRPSHLLHKTLKKGQRKRRPAWEPLPEKNSYSGSPSGRLLLGVGLAQVAPHPQLAKWELWSSASQRGWLGEGHGSAFASLPSHLPAS